MRLRFRYVGLVVGVTLIAVPIIVGTAATKRPVETEIAFVMVPAEAGSPVRILKATSEPDAPFGTVLVRNESSRAIRSITFGIVLLPKAVVKPINKLLTGSPVVGEIRPGETRDMRSALPDGKTFARYWKNWPDGGTAEFGVLRVEYVGGGSWTFDMRAGRFGTGPVPFVRHVRPCSAEPTFIKATVGISSPDEGSGHFKCGETEAPIMCAVESQTKCSETACSNPKDCASQGCLWLEVTQ